MKTIYLTLHIDGRQSATQLASIAEGAAEHLTTTYNDLGILKKVSWHTPGAGKQLRAKILAELQEWRDECHDISCNLKSAEEMDSYDAKLARIDALIKEVTQS